MIILGIDPGKTVGLCLYDSESKAVLSSVCCTAPGLDAELHRLLPQAELVAVERPRVYGSGGREIADACEQCGWLIRRCGGMPVAAPLDGSGGAIVLWGHRVSTFERRAVLKALSGAIGQSVTKDAGVWQALLVLHGEDSGKKGGVLFGVKSHGRAALAVAWAAAQKEQELFLAAVPF